MTTKQITPSVFSVGVLNPNMRVFDIVMHTEFGTSYNAYLIKGEKNVLIETVHLRNFDELVENIEAAGCKKLDYIILNHTEPDHSGSLRKIALHYPDAQVISSPGGAIYLKNITNLPNLSVKAVKDGETMDIGGGKVLKFIHAPFLHWPDSMFTWFEQEKVLFTCDFLGAHFCEPRMIDTKIIYGSHYQTAFRGYFDAIFAPFKPYVLKGLDKMAPLDAEFVCNSHGPVLTKDGLLPRAMELYRAWSTPEVHDKKLIPIFYCSAYGNTKSLAESIARGISSVLSEADIRLYDIIENDMAVMAHDVNEADAVLIGSPTLNKDAVPPVWDLIAHIDAINCKGKKCALFGSYGWSGEAVPALENRLKGLKMEVYGETCRVVLVSSEDDLNRAFEFGADFAKTL